MKVFDRSKSMTGEVEEPVVEMCLREFWDAKMEAVTVGPGF